MGKRTQIAAMCAALLFGGGALYPEIARAQSDANTQAYAIPAGNLNSALRQFSQQSRVQLIYPTELADNKKSAGLSGSFTAAEALRRLLDGSGLVSERVNDKTVVLRRAPASAKEEPRSRTRNAPTAAQSAEPATQDLEKVTVTGTRIRGGSTPSPVITIGSEQIQQEGFTDLGEVIRSIPQNFGGGQNPEVPVGNLLLAGIGNQNITGGSGLNLRGLGADATLTLLNGRRLSYGGFSQAVDISAIPVDAVERIEIVTDGASAIYGSDAVGGVGNVVLKRDYEGITVGARYGGATDGGLTTREFTVTAGTTWSSGGLITAFKNASADPIQVSQRAYTDYMPNPRTLYPGSDLSSGLLSIHQQLGSNVELRLDAIKSKRGQESSYLTALPQYSYLTPETTSTSISPSIEISLPNHWALTFGGSWGKDEHIDNQSTVVVATGISTLVANGCYCNEILTYEAGAEGPLFTFPGGDARLAVGAGYRKNELVQANYLTGGGNAIDSDESGRFAYAEINMPLFGSDQNIAGVHRLSLTGAVRAEDYDSFGSVTTPKLGVIYGPSADFTLKASWGKSFKAPMLVQRYDPGYARLDPRSFYGGTGHPAGATVLSAGGGNPDLEAERARTWTASLAFHPEALPGLEAELTLFDIDYTDRVVLPVTVLVQALSNPIYAQFVDYSPTVEALESLLSASRPFYNLTGSPYDPNQVVAIVDARYINVARQRIRGFDLSGAYRFDLGVGRLTVRGSASWLDSTQQTNSAQEDFDLAGTLYNPAKVNGRIGAVWNQGGFSASAFANHTGGITDTARSEKSGSFTTFDATLRYATGEQRNVLSGLELALSAQNLFDRAPPFSAPTSLIYSLPYDPTNYSAVGRYLSVSVSKRW